MRLLRRVAGLLRDPSQEWDAIAREPADVASLYRRHIVLLAAIPSLATLCGILMAGGRYLGTAGITTAVTAAIVSYAMALVVPLATAVILEHLSPRFRAGGDTAQTLKLVAYSFTPIWLAGVFYLSLWLGRLALVGLPAAAYLFYKGVSPMLDAPVEQRVPLTLVTAIAVLALQMLLEWAASLARIPFYTL